MGNKIGKILGRFAMWLGGWKIVGGGLPEGVRKAVLVSAPHTSNWDFLWARAALYVLDVPVRYTIKKEFMRFPLGPFMRLMGAIPIDRSKPGAGQSGGLSTTDAIINLFNEREDLFIIVTPEGTRAYNPNWKTGFYYAAKGANVLLCPAFLNYEKKEAGVGPGFFPTGDVEADIERLKEFYRPIPGKYPEQGVR